MYYIQQDEKILLFDDDKQRLQNTIAFMPQYQGLEIKEVQKGYVIYEFELMTVEEMEKKEAQFEKERINNLTCTKRVFALMLQEVGITYTQLKELIATNEQAQLEWELCIELQRGNPLLDVMAAELNITSEHLDLIFKFANNEITEEEFTEQIQLLNKEVVEE